MIEEQGVLKNLDFLIEQELKEWAKEGLNPAALQHHSWSTHVNLIALTEFLVEQDVISQYDYNVKTRQVMLRELEAARKQFGAEIRKARILEGIQVKEPPLQ
jgi:hypothetical protein